MNRKFTPQTKRLITTARDIAIKHEHKFIDAFHLLLAYIELYENKNGLEGIMAIKKSDILDIIEKIDYDKETNKYNVGNLSLTKYAEKSLKVTFLEAKQFNQEDLTPDHVMLSILKVCHEELKNFDVDYEELKKQVRQKNEKEHTQTIADETPEPPSAEQPSAEQSSALDIFFNSEEFSIEEITELLFELSEVYHSIGGDYLEIKGLETFDFVSCKNPILA